MYTLVDGHDIDLSHNESITEDDTTDTTLGVRVRTGGIVCGTPGTYRNYKVKVERKQIRNGGRRKTQGERTR